MPAKTRANLRQLLSDLVAMPTFTIEHGTCQAAIDWVRHQVRGLPLHVAEYHVPVGNGGGRNPVLVLTTRDTKRPKLMLHAHLDVAPAPASELKLTARDGRYYGRGVFDMKYAAATFLHLLLELGDDLTR